MADIISIATAVPEYCHKQSAILHFMQGMYELNEQDARKLKFLYDHSGIQTRYSAIKDYGVPVSERDFIPKELTTPFPSLELRMEIYNREAVKIAKKAIQNCMASFIEAKQITHLITVSCTGMSAPGLDLQLMDEMELAPDIFRTSINFMGCYAAIHALKMAKMICDSSQNANVVIVATELCTLHFQKEYTIDNAASSLLFADGAASILVSNCIDHSHSLSIKGFYSYVSARGKADMAWQLSSTGFLMTLSSYVPKLIEEDISQLIQKAVLANGIKIEDITHWCIHPGGKRILDVIQKQLHLSKDDLRYSREVLQQYGNMSSPTVLFVLKKILSEEVQKPMSIAGMAFGPGLTMETFIAERK